MIETRGLTKYYGPKMAISDVTFQVEKGEVLGFLGPNGAGKTTTMRILTCYLSPTRGSASVAGFDLFEEPLEVRRRIGYLPENVPLYREMRVSPYLNFVAEVKGIRGRSSRRAQVGKAMESCGLLEVQERILGHLSKGYQQRVGLAQALLGEPEVLILDEPTVGLDPKQIIEIRQLIRALGEARTVILSTHILHEVEMTCGRVVIINEGRIVAQDTPQNLTRRLQGAARVEVIVGGDTPRARVARLLEGMPGTQKVEKLPAAEGGGLRFLVESEATRDLRSGIAEALVSNRIPLLSLRAQDLTLEEIFIRTVSQDGGKEGKAGA